MVDFMQKTTDLKLNFLGVIPWYETKKFKLNPQEVAAFSGLLTFRGNSVNDLVQEAQAKKQDINKKIKFILRKSSLRGHASMATMPVFCFTFEASKMIGSMITGITFSSALMHSGRRADVGIDNNVYPTAIAKNKKALAIYKKASEKNINGFNKLQELGISKDEAGKILHYGTYGTGIITLPAESLATFLREYEIEKEWMPEEGGILLRKIEKEMKKLGVDLLYATRSVAPKNTYPYPNLFKDPDDNNLVRDLVREGHLKNRNIKVVGIDSYLGKGFKKRVIELKQKQKELFSSNRKLKNRWNELLDLRRKLIRDYGSALNVKTLTHVSWRIWRDKKRHRTASIITESIYFCLKEACKVVNQVVTSFNKKGDLNVSAVKKLDKVLAVPPILGKKEKTRRIYLDCAISSLIAYQELLKIGIKERDAVFVIPRAIRITMFQEYNMYNILDGYYSLRSCPTADEQIYRQTKEELKQIKQKLKRKKLSYLNDIIEPKCNVSGFCPEEESCGYIKKQVRWYNQKFHESMKDDLEARFMKKLEKLN
jgi:thymidylate synthase ThyX